MKQVIIYQDGGTTITTEQREWSDLTFYEKTIYILYIYCTPMIYAIGLFLYQIEKILGEKNE